jgi:hypothetical protein
MLTVDSCYKNVMLAEKNKNSFGNNRFFEPGKQTQIYKFIHLFIIFDLNGDACVRHRLQNKASSTL